MRKILVFFALTLFSLITLGLTSSHKVSAAETDPPTLSKPSFDGNETFSVFYSDPNRRAPVTIFVTIPAPVGTRKADYPLEAIGSGPPYADTYQTKVNRKSGTYTYQFFANNGTYDAVKALDETALGISEEATFTPGQPSSSNNTSDNPSGCALSQSNINNFKISSFFFLISIGILFLRYKRMKS